MKRAYKSIYKTPGTTGPFNTTQRTINMAGLDTFRAAPTEKHITGQ